MAAPPAQLGQPLPIWISRGGGKAAHPLRMDWVTREALTPVHQWGMPRQERNGNDHTIAQAGFFRLDVSTTFARAPHPYVSDWVTREALTKWQQFGSRDYALRKILDDWFLGAAQPFGRPVERSKLQNADGNGVSGWGSFPLLSDWVTRESLTRNHAFGNGDTTLQTKILDWFFGRTTGSEDMHILYTRGRYA